MGAKLVAGITGFAGGIISGFVGGLLDLGKMAVGFLAGLLGFDGVKEALASFSFREMIYEGLMFPFRFFLGLFQGDGNIFQNFAENIFSGITSIFDKIKNFIKEKF